MLCKNLDASWNYVAIFHRSKVFLLIFVLFYLCQINYKKFNILPVVIIYKKFVSITREKRNLFKKWISVEK